MSQISTDNADTNQPHAPAPAHRYDARLAGEIELRWQKVWADRGTFRQPNPGEDGFDGSKPKFYCLDMFPYPSGAGLHVGHPEGYTATDIICRHKKMLGFNVLHPMGFDAFGLPAEQYAIQTGVHPAVTTRKAIDNFRRQLQRFGFCYDWSRELATIDEDYYGWTQWIFLKIYGMWFDPEAGDGRGRGRPIDELVAEFAAGKRKVRVNPDAAEHSGEDKSRRYGAWDTLSDAERRTIVDSYRLAYLGEQTVNWCPKLGTALANEEVIDGKSERGGFPVLRKPMRQWMFRITAYADRLLDDLGEVDWPNSTRTQQAEWIGKSSGAEIDFELLDAPAGAPGTLRVYTTRPDTVFGATYMVVAPEHGLVDAAIAAAGEHAGELRAYAERARNRSDVERQESKTKTGVFTGVCARNPATGESVPVWCADYVLMGYGTGAIMAVPSGDERDFEFAQAFGLPIRDVCYSRAVMDARKAVYEGREPASWPEELTRAGASGVDAARHLFDTMTVHAKAGRAFTEPGYAVNSSNAGVSLDGLPMAEAKDRLITWLENKGHGSGKTNYRLRDWLFSRQRYWGEPFPIVFDEHGDHHPIDESALPVTLPELADYEPVESEDPQPLLAKVSDWVHTTAGEAGAVGLPADAVVTRETNTMPGWAGSCWYYLRYCDPKNGQRFASREAERYWMTTPREGVDPAEAAEFGTYEPDKVKPGGVDLYVGGAEHAVLHLLYARFWHKCLFDLGEVSTPEPFGKLFHQGLITSFAYQRKDRSLVPIDEVVEKDGGFVETATGERVVQITAKMSKSLRNVVNPDDVIAEFGADTFRLYEMYMGPLADTKPWDTRAIGGMSKFLGRAWRLAVNEDTGGLLLSCEANTDVERALHKAIAKVGGDVGRLAFNTAIAAMIEFVNTATAAGPGVLTRDQLDRFVRTLCPFAPHMAEELWAKMDQPGLCSDAAWPSYDESMLVADSVEVAVQLMGKLKARITVPAGLDARALEEAALSHAEVKPFLAGLTVRKVVAVPDRLVNIVAN